ncbi:MAG: transposase [Acidobacteria bacterium]|nr:transposase [Acidobacteriota bacterium]
MADSIIRRTYKFRIYPSKAQTLDLQQQLAEGCRLYNAALRERKDAYRLNRVSLNYYTQANQLKDIRANGDLALANFSCCQDILRRVDKTFKAFFRRVKAGQKAGFPRFRSIRRFDTITFPSYGDGIKLTDKLRIQGVGLVKVKLHRPIDGKIKTVSIKREGSKWYACFSVETKPEPLPRTDQAIGIDVGIESFATLSDGTHIDNWKYYESEQKRLRVAQRRVTRRKKGSNRRRKAVAQLRNIHQKIFNRRNDFQHKLSTDLVRNYDLIAVEKLNILGMSKGILSKQIHDASWSSFFQKLRFKAECAGKQLIEVDPRGTSQRCTCGVTVKKDLSVRWHHCFSCGYQNHRDIVSAQNILSLGLSDNGSKYQVADRLPLEAVCFS